MTMCILQKLKLNHKYSQLLLLFNRNYTCNSQSPEISKALKESQEVKLMSYRLGWCRFGDNFSRAQIDVMQYLTDRRGTVRTPYYVSSEDVKRDKIETVYTGFNSVFRRGFEILEKYTNNSLETDQELMMDPLHLRLVKYACNSLAQALKNIDIHENCMQKCYDDEFRDLQYDSFTKCEITALLANHVFSRLLSPDTGKYIITSDTNGKQSLCPCGCGGKIHHGSLEFGTEQLWYGKPDIMLFPVGGSHFNVVIPFREGLNDLEDFDDAFLNEEHIVEDISDASSIRNDRSVMQSVAQAITFSFYQNKHQRDNEILPFTNLIPTISVCSDAFDVFMYDSENDILLRNTEPVYFWKNGNFNVSALLELWMLINHLTIKPSLNERQIISLKGTCGLQTFLDGKRNDLIKNTIEMRTTFRDQMQMDLKNIPGNYI